MKKVVLAAFVLAALTACAKEHKPIDPDLISTSDEMPKGPGLFTGKDGAFKKSF